MGTVQKFYDACRRETQVERQNPPTELSTAYFGREHRALLFCLNMTEVTVYFAQDLNHRPCMPCGRKKNCSTEPSTLYCRQEDRHY